MRVSPQVQAIFSHVRKSAPKPLYARGHMSGDPPRNYLPFFEKIFLDQLNRGAKAGDPLVTGFTSDLHVLFIIESIEHDPRQPVTFFQKMSVEYRGIPDRFDDVDQMIRFFFGKKLKEETDQIASTHYGAIDSLAAQLQDSQAMFAILAALTEHVAQKGVPSGELINFIFTLGVRTLARFVNSLGEKNVLAVLKKLTTDDVVRVAQYFQKEKDLAIWARIKTMIDRDPGILESVLAMQESKVLSREFLADPKTLSPLHCLIHFFTQVEILF